jgi:serine/threonine protein kinase
VLYPLGRPLPEGLNVAKPEVTTIGKYQVLDCIAQGDLAEIYKARLDGIAGFRRMFAIKRVRPHLAHLDTYAEMIEEEARIAGLLSHSNIVQLLDLGRENGVLYLVMELVDGWDLGAVLDKARERGQPLPVAHVAWIGQQLLKGLEYAHQREVIRDGERVSLALVHRDVSPSNVLLSRQGEVKLTDFGIARASLKMMQTHPDLVKRRFDYMSPEQARGGDITQAADLFGTAIVLYECLTLQHPFRREGEFATLEAIRDGAFTPLPELRDDLPEVLVEVIHAGLNPKVDKRPANATAFKEKLAQVQALSDEVFTQETLAAWLGELLGEPERKPVGPTLHAADDDEGADDELPDLPATPDPTQPSPLTFDGRQPMDEEAHTVVMSRLDLPAWEAEEGATVVNRDVAARLAALRRDKDGKPTPAPAAPAKSSFEQEEATRVRPNLVRELLEEPQVRENPGSAWLTGVLAAGLMLMVGALLGAVLTVAYGRSGGMMINPPMLDVRSAPDVPMQVTVDGAPISGPRRLAAGQHRLKVDMAGAQPWEVDLTLEAGEYRLMMIEAHQLPAAAAE